MPVNEHGGDLSALREQNLRRILGTLLGVRDGTTQPRISELTGLSRSTVSSLLGERHLGAVLETSRRRNGANSGRPVSSWRIDPHACHFVGVDIGQTHVSAVLVNPFGQIVGAGPLQEPMEVLAEPHGTLSLASELVERLTLAEGIECEDIAAVTVGLPGPVDSATGSMAEDASHPWAGIDVRAEIRKRWPHSSVPNRLADNNANLGALAEHRFGAGYGSNSLIYLDWSTGLGSGLLLGGRIWRGKSGFAGEVGHLPVTASSEEMATLGLKDGIASLDSCPQCRQHGCLDQLVGGRTVADALKLDDLSAVVRVALASDDPDREAAREVLKVAARLIGKAIGPSLTLLNTDKVILGGAVGVPALYPLLVEDLSVGIDETAFRPARRDVSLEIGALGSDAPVLGAGLLGLDRYAVDFLITKSQRLARPVRKETEEGVKETETSPV